MMWIEMVMWMSGTRANGDKYPPAFTAFEVEDWEGQHLVRGGQARQAAPPQAVKAAAPAEDFPREVMPAPVPQSPRSEPSFTAAGPVTQEPAPAVQPAPADQKQAWVDYAVSQGADAELAARMTKADLMSRYGSRL